MPDEYVDLEYDLHRVEAGRGVLELAVRQLRAFARCVTASRTEADDLVEDTLMLFLAEDRVLRECETCFAELLEVFRRVYSRIALIQAARTVPEREYAGFMQLALPEREVAALALSGDMSARHTADLLGLTLAETEALLEAVRQKLGADTLPRWPFLLKSEGAHSFCGDDGIG